MLGLGRFVGILGKCYPLWFNPSLLWPCIYLKVCKMGRHFFTRDSVYWARWRGTWRDFGDDKNLTYFLANESSARTCSYFFPRWCLAKTKTSPLHLPLINYILISRPRRSTDPDQLQASHWGLVRREAKKVLLRQRTSCQVSWLIWWRDPFDGIEHQCSQLATTSFSVSLSRKGV